MPKLRWRNNNNEMDLKETAFKGMGLIRLAQTMAQWRSLIDKIRNHDSS